MSAVIRLKDRECPERFLRSRRGLLVLDNLEHLLPAAPLVTRLLTACPGLTVLATSREPLGIVGERVCRLEPLQPEHAYRLFLERARERRPELVPDGDTEVAIFNICATLDQLPAEAARSSDDQ